jgi:peptidoglycan hydrolase CwlO-like protein
MTNDPILGRLQGSMDYMISRLALTDKEIFLMSQEMDNLTSRVERCNTVMDSAAALLGTLSTEIAKLKNDPVQLQALADRLNAETDELAAAVASNTAASEETEGTGEPSQPA